MIYVIVWMFCIVVKTNSLTERGNTKGCHIRLQNLAYIMLYAK